MHEFPWASETDEVTEIEFVDGPRDRQVASSTEFPESISDAAGRYRCSVRCADDRVLRYVWEPVARGGDPG